MLKESTQRLELRKPLMPKLNFSLFFQEVFIAVLFLTLLSGGTSLYLASQETLSTQQNHIFESSTTTWQMGVGAIFGLLGRKTTDLLHSQDEADEEEK